MSLQLDFSTLTLQDALDLAVLIEKEAVRAKGAEVFELRCDVTCEAEVRAMVEVAVTRP